MSKKNKNLLISSIRILLVLILIVFIFLMGIRGEFTKYLEVKYSDLSFDVGFVKTDPIYGNFYANVTCLNDYTFFPISKSFKTKNIHEDYPQHKSRNQYNSKIIDIFDGSDLESYITSITGGSKIPFENDGVYTQINIYLIDDAEHILVVKKVMNVLEQNNISAEKIIFTYEKDKHVYEIWLSSYDYALTENEIEAKVEKIK
ncbi:MAG: hypothetical protein PHW84_15510 [Methanosarcina sp.]|nr:hypothetical protein [Methanosarcina sp.]